MGVGERSLGIQDWEENSGWQELNIATVTKHETNMATSYVTKGTVYIYVT